MSGNYGILFEKGVNRQFGLKLQTYDPQWRKVFHVQDTTDRYVWAQGWTGYQSPTFRIPGQRISSGNFAPDFSKAYIIRGYGLADQFPQEDIDDDLYGVINLASARKGGLFAQAFMDLMEIQTANYFGTQGFASGSSVAGMADGVSLFNTAHPLSAQNQVSTWTNRPTTDADLSITTAQFLLTNLMLQKASNNVTVLNNKMKAIVYNPILTYVARQIFRGSWQGFSADLNDNVTKQVAGDIDLIEWPYFTKGGSTGGAYGSGAANAYFGIGQQHHLYFYLRQAAKSDTDKSVTTNSQIITMTCRFDMGADTARGLAGSAGA